MNKLVKIYLNFYKNKNTYLFILYGLGFLALFYLQYQANIVLSAGRHVLGMDERTAFNGVQRILDSNSFSGLYWSIMDGEDHRYGRIFWNAQAFFSAIPKYLYGASGQIIASRIIQAIFLYAAVLIFSFGLLKLWINRLAFSLAMLTVPYADYYLTNPKPEPEQILCLAIFLLFYFRRSFCLGRYWFFLGLAFGSKISTLPLVVIFLSFTYFNKLSFQSLADNRDSLIKTFIWFVFGFSCAVPIFIKPFIIATILYVAFKLYKTVILIKFPENKLFFYQFLFNFRFGSFFLQSLSSF